jgi:predicted deacylase
MSLGKIPARGVRGDFRRLPMPAYVEVGPLEAARGTKTHGSLSIAMGADGSELAIPVHVIAGREDGPKLVVLSSAHGYEIRQISVLHELVRKIDPQRMVGTLVLVPVANPVAFEMGVRCTWMDSLWGDSGNMNRLWPGRPNGWITERFCHAIATQLIPSAAAVLDLHGSIYSLAVGYGYLGDGGPGDLDYDISRAFGTEILVYNSPEEIAEKRQQGTSKSWLRSVGIPALSCEIGEFHGLETERTKHPPERLFRGVPELGLTGVTNVMKHLGMLEGEVVRPTVQVAVQPELNVRPSHGGLLATNFGIPDIGRVLPRDAVLGTVYSPYSFKALETLTAPFEQNLLLGTSPLRPFTKVNPGDYAYIVADWGKTRRLSS